MSRTRRFRHFTHAERAAIAALDAQPALPKQLRATRVRNLLRDIESALTYPCSDLVRATLETTRDGYKAELATLVIQG